MPFNQNQRKNRRKNLKRKIKFGFVVLVAKVIEIFTTIQQKKLPYMVAFPVETLIIYYPCWLLIA